MCFLTTVYVSLLFSSASPVSSISPSWSPVTLAVRTIPVSIEGLGMASTLVNTGQVLLTGGFSRVGRGAVARLLFRGPESRRCVSVEPSVDLGESALCFILMSSRILFFTLTL